jgi:bifunctional non-homologous end joining protein LigD
MPRAARPQKRSHVPRTDRVPKKGSRPSVRRAQAATAKPTSRGTPEDVAFTHVEKVMFPDARLTKGDVLKYYVGVADTLLPHLRDRPVTLERLPDGVGEGKPRFWQKNTPAYYPKWIPRIELPTAQGKPVQYALVNDAETLAYLVNQGAITFHTYLSRVQNLDRPDFVVFDFDPGSARFTDVVRLARGLHEILDDQSVASFPKTSGKSGLHVVVPWTQPGDYDAARGWAMTRAEKLVAEFPNLATVERLKDKRGGRIYVDVIQNAEGHHVVPPYVLRAIPRATVSTPLDWKEVTPKLNPAKFTTAEVFKRLTKRKDPMAALGKR